MEFRCPWMADGLHKLERKKDMITINRKYNHNKYSDDEINVSISEILNENKLLSMATVNEHGSWINTAFYCFNKDMEFFILTELDAQHSKNLKENPTIALTIFDSHQEWGPGKLKGIQIFGSCEKTQGTSLIEGVTLYIKRYPGVSKYMLKPDDLLKGLLGSWVYIIKPQNVKILDEKRFGEENYITAKISE